MGKELISVISGFVVMALLIFAWAWYLL